MAIISDALKRILAGLAYQDAGDYLSMREKIDVLGYKPNHSATPVATHKTKPRKYSKHIALLSDGRGNGAPLDYALDACQRQHASIDLLIHGKADSQCISNIEKQAKNAGVDCKSMHLGINPISDITEYVARHASLIFLVTLPDDVLAKELIEEIIPNRGRQFPIPLVLIDDHQITPHEHYDSACSKPVKLQLIPKF